MPNSSPPFYNRAPWNLIVAMSVLTIGIIQIARATTLWLLAAPLLVWVYVTLSRETRRTLQLRRLGYFPGTRRRSYWIYEERDGFEERALLLPVANTEPGHWELFVPDDAAWRRLVPDWAADRRSEISRRIAEAWKPEDIHLPADAVSPN